MATEFIKSNKLRYASPVERKYTSCAKQKSSRIIDILMTTKMENHYLGIKNGLDEQPF